MNKRLDKLEKKVISQTKRHSQGLVKPRGEDSPASAEQAEEQARAAERLHHVPRGTGDTLRHLDSQTQSAYHRQEWFAKKD